MSDLNHEGNNKIVVSEMRAHVSHAQLEEHGALLLGLAHGAKDAHGANGEHGAPLHGFKHGTSTEHSA